MDAAHFEEGSALFYAALARVNKNLEETAADYRIALDEDKHAIDPKMPTYLRITNKVESKSLGVIHLLRLEGEDFDEKLVSPSFYLVEWKKMARSVDEVTAAIFARIELYFSSETNPAIFINKENGQLFMFGDCHVVIAADKTFMVDGKKVTHRGRELKISSLISEYVLKFKYVENGNIQIDDEYDKRVGKGIYIAPNGEVFRA